MVRSLLAAAVAASALGVASSPAHAAAHGCLWPQASTDGVTTGLLGAVLLPDAGESLTLTCYVNVNGATIAEATTSSGVAVEPVAFYTPYTAHVDFCYRLTWSSGSADVCEDATAPQIPPQFVIDLLCAVFGCS